MTLPLDSRIPPSRPPRSERESALLAIETSSPRGGLALFSGSDLLLAADFPPGLVHGREVVPRIAELLAEARIERRGVKGIAVGIGPGSYTGCRVGVTAAKTLSWALRCPVVGISSLEVLAASLDALERDADGSIVTVLDARRGAYFVARFAARNGALEREMQDTVGRAEELRDLFRGGGRVVGDGAPILLGELRAASASIATESATAERWRVVPDVFPLAVDLGRLAAPRLAGLVFDPAATHALEPEYLRPSEPEIRRRRTSVEAADTR